MTRTGSTEEGLTFGVPGFRQRSSVFRPSPYYELVPGMKNNVTNFRDSLYIDKEGNKLSYKVTGKSVPRESKMKVSKTGRFTKPDQFVFPRRKRFNEDVDKEIQSQRSQSKEQF